MQKPQNHEAALPGAASRVENSDKFRDNFTAASSFSKADFEEKSTNPKDRFSSSRERSAKVEREHKERHAPLPLQREPIPPTPFPFEVLGPTLGPVAQRIHEVVKAPDSVCGQSVLAVASLITQPHANVHIDGREHPLSLFFLTVAQSGDRKSAVDAIVLKPVRDYEKMLAVEFEKEKKAFQIKHDIWKKQKEFLLKVGQGGKFDKKDLENKLNNFDEEPKPPLQPHLIIEEPTFPGLLQLYAIGRPSIGLFSDEGGRMFGGHGMKEENLLNTICGLSSLWDGKPISRIRKSDENLLLYERRLAAHLMIQETVLVKILKNEQLVGQGMIARCLMVFPPSNAGNRPYNEIDVSTDQIIQRFYRQASEILDTPAPLKNSNIGNELSPRPLPLSADAKIVWVKFHNEIDSLLGPEGRYRPIARTANKSAEQALRIAGVLTLIENIDARVIDLNVIERAIVLARFYLDEMLRITEGGFADPGLDMADALMDWMKRKNTEHGGGKIFCLREIYRGGGSRGIRTKEIALKNLRILEDHQAVSRLTQNGSKWKVCDDV